ncbi:MAG TPA: FMN-binding negative transcriptional regulator [Acidobacteriaceae bacterium]|jgi:transcriptional regulator|nr:FMN-binding negative transcriptional regulator [Acidobacteriaceae bacterium]
MYIPQANRETRVPVMHELISAYPFGTLITAGNSGLIASHIPIVLEQDGSELGTLRAHIARANPQWSDFTPSIDALAIFSGPHHYISASWYPGAKEDGAEVPTWNYVVVHAYGPLRVVESPEWLLAHLVSLVDIHEAGSANPWKVSDAPAEFIHQQMRGIVGLEMPIRRLEGKWKVSQNRNGRDRSAVSEGLADLGTPESLIMKKLVEGR